MKKIGLLLLSLALAMAVPANVPGWEMALCVVLLIGSLFFAPAAKHGLDAYTNGISKEIWEARIEGNLFPKNSFVLSMTDASEYVNVKTVHHPNAGPVPTIVKNRSHGGARVDPTLRVDTITDWSIDEYTTNPFIITNAEEVELSYNKMDSVLYEQQMALRKSVCDSILIRVAPTGTGTLPDTTVNHNILRSSGITNNDVADIRSSAAYTPGATGNRLNFTLYDIRQAKKLFDRQNVPDEDRSMIMSPDAMDQLVNDMIATKYRGDVGDIYSIETGEIRKLMGFTIYKRSQVCQYDNSATPVVKAEGAAGAADDNDAILFWQKAGVEYAIGDIHVYATLNSATDYGDIYSALVRTGGNKVRNSELGVGAIVQAVPA